jgi:hypothetical protein
MDRFDLDRLGSPAEYAVEVVGRVSFVVFHQYRRLTEAVSQPVATRHDLLQIVVDVARGSQRCRTGVACPPGGTDDVLVAAHILVGDCTGLLQSRSNPLLRTAQEFWSNNGGICHIYVSLD